MTNKELLDSLMKMDKNVIIEGSIKKCIELLKEITNSNEPITFEKEMIGLGCATQLNILRCENLEVFEKYEKEVEETWESFHHKVLTVLNDEVK